MTTEHCRLIVSPTVTVTGVEMVTTPISTVAKINNIDRDTKTVCQSIAKNFQGEIEDCNRAAGNLATCAEH